MGICRTGDGEAAEVKGSELEAIMEHIAHVGDVGGVEIAHVESSEAGAAREHTSHVSDVGSVEAAQVESSEAGAVKEHITHVGDVGGVEFAYVEAGKTFTVIEHSTHVGDVAGIEVVDDVCEAGERTHAIEPLVAGSGPGVAEAVVERHIGDVAGIAIPCRSVRTRVQAVDRLRGLLLAVIVVVVEGEGVAVYLGVGLYVLADETAVIPPHVVCCPLRE